MLTAKTSKRESASLLIKGGHLIDPAAKINAPMDVLLRDGRVAEIALPNKTRGGADEKFDARGLIVALDSSICMSTCANPAKAIKKLSLPVQRPLPREALPRSAP